MSTYTVGGTGRAGLEGADEIVARLRQEASLMRERGAEARSRLQATHVSSCSMQSMIRPSD